MKRKSYIIYFRCFGLNNELKGSSTKEMDLETAQGILLSNIGDAPEIIKIKTGDKEIVNEDYRYVPFTIKTEMSDKYLANKKK